MKYLLLTLVLFITFNISSQTTTERMNNNYITSISIGIDPKPLFDDTSTGGLDINAKVIFGQEHKEFYISSEYFYNIDYLSIGAGYDWIIFGQGTSFNKIFQGLIGPEILLLSRFTNAQAKLPTGFFGLSGGLNGTLRWYITEKIGIEGIINYKYRPDKRTLWNETSFNKLVDLSGRLNIIIIL